MDESLALCRRLGNAYSLSFVLKNLSEVAVVMGHFERAKLLLSESLELGCSLGSREAVGCALTGFAALAAAARRPTRAAHLFGAAEAIREAVGAPLSEMQRATYDRFLTLAQDQLGAMQWVAQVEFGRALTMEQAVECALETALQPIVRA
jgi:hypothetical protein